MFDVRANRWVFLLIALAILVRAAIPMGYMPDKASGKTFQMVICSMDGPKTVTMDSGFDPNAPAEKSDHAVKADHCDFAVLKHNVMTSALLDHVIFPVPMGPVKAIVPPLVVAVQTEPAYRQAQPRAPPVFSV